MSPRLETALRATLAVIALASPALATTSRDGFLHAPHAAAAAPAPARPDASLAQRPVRDVRTLPTLNPATGSLREPGVLAPIVTPTDSFLVQSWSFDGVGGACSPRGFVGEDRVEQIYAHVTDDPSYLVNVAFHRGVPYQGPGNSGENGRIYFGNSVTVDDQGRVIFHEAASMPRFLRTVPGTFVLTQVAQSDFPGTFVTGTVWDPVLGTFLSSGEGRIERWDQAPPRPALFAGGGASTQDTTSAASLLGAITQMVADASGNIYWADNLGHRIRMLRRNDMRVITLVGNGSMTSTGDGGPGSAATVGIPYGVALDDSEDLLYFTDGIGGSIRALNLATGIVSQVATTAAGFVGPERILFANDDLYLVDYAQPGHATTSVIRRLDLATGTSAIVVGGGDDYGPASEANLGTSMRFQEIHSLDADAAGNVYFNDRFHAVVMQLTPAGVVSGVAGRIVPIHMGTHALRFGTDASQLPDEVSNWVRPSGYGNDWSQRLVSPPVNVNVAGAMLRFQGVLELGDAQDVFTPGASSDGEFVVVQAQDGDGSWINLQTRFNPVTIQGYDAPDQLLRGWIKFDAEVDFGTDNSFITWPNPTRVRIVVQTGPTGSPEDGGTLHPHAAGAAVIDNITLTSSVAGNLTPPLDFEDGTTGAWTLEALNGDPSVTFIAGYVRNLPQMPQTDVALRDAFDFNDGSCVWTFLSQADSVQRRGTLARLATPWFASPPTPDMLISFSGKLNTINQGRFLSMAVRGKNAGDPRPAFISHSAFLLNSGTYGADVASPFLNHATVRFPQDFVGATTLADSFQVVFEVADITQSVDSFLFPEEFRFLPADPTALPYLDDIRFYAIGVDTDFDGVANADDACPNENAAGQDADGDGCVDPTASMREVESWNLDALPLRYSIAAGGDPDIADESEVQVLHDAFQVWANVPGASLTVSPAPQTISSNASATDGINLVTWADPDFQFPPNVVAVTPTLSFTKRAGYQDVVARPGQIVDADLMFNPSLAFRTPSHDPGPNSFDLLSVAVHEIGHFLGLTHSGTLDASMFFVLQPGEDAASLSDDDRAAVAAAFPAPSLATDFGAITGRVLRGGSGNPIPGALVTAVRLGNGGALDDSTASDYTDELGRYALRRLPAGDYAVRVTPLDGEVGGWPLGPEYISLRLVTIAETNFAAEWWDAAESNTDDPEARDAQTVAAGAVVADVDVVTNNDVTGPEVLAVAPAPDTTGINIDTNVLVSFSERIDPASVNAQSFQFRRLPGGNPLPGSGLLVNGERRLIFTPSQPLQFGSEYEVRITTSLRDREGVPLASDHVTTFETLPQPPIAITDIQPRTVLAGESFITILGTGFADTLETNYVVSFDDVDDGNPPLAATPVSVTPASMIVTVPGSVGLSGLAAVSLTMTGGPPSNTFQIDVQQPPPQVSLNTGVEAPLAFAPSDVTITPDNLRAIAVGTGGLATVGLNPLAPAEYGPIGAARQLALMPDGLRGYATRPDSGDVVEVDLDPNSGTYRQILAEVLIGDGAGTPLGIALDPAGLRAHVTDPAAGRIYTLDVDARSVTRNQVILERVAPAPLTEGIASHPADFFLISGSPSAGTLVSSPLLPDAATQFDSFTSGGGVAFSPGGNEYLLSGASANPGVVSFRDINAAASGNLATGGRIRDVAFTPLGQSALLVNQDFNQVMVMNTVSTSPDYHDILSLHPTGASPVAIDVSADGGRVAVANQGSNSVSLYTTTVGGVQLVSVSPPVAIAGDAVAIRLDADNLAAGATAEIASVSTPLTHINQGANGGGLKVPAIEPQATSLTAESGSYRSNARPFQVVPPVSAFAPAPFDAGLTIVPQPCGFGNAAGQIRRMKVSPDGRLLATLTSQVDCPQQYVRIYRFDDDGPQRLHAPLIGVQVNTTGSQDNVTDIQWSPDGLELWFSQQFQTTFGRMNADPNSGAFGTVAVQAGPPAAGNTRVLALDPTQPSVSLGMGLLGIQDVSVYELDAQSGFLQDSIVIDNVTDVYALAYSPDGRVCMVGGNEATVVLDNTGDLVEVARHPSPAGIEGFAPASHFAFTTDGRYAVALHGGNGWLRVYNIDPAFGPVGALVHTATELTLAQGPCTLVPGSDGHSVLVGASLDPNLRRYDLSTIPPGIQTVAVAEPVRMMARSYDGRRLYAASHTDDGITAMIRPLMVGVPSAVSLVSGANQTATVSTTLPYPIRVRVLGASGEPEPGAVVRFTESTSGQFLEGQGSVFLLTDANGEASVQYRTAGVAGAFSLSARVVGSALDSIVVTGTVAGTDAETPPVITLMGPVDGQTNLNANTAAFVRFNQRMDSTSVATRMKLYANGGEVPGGYDVVDDGRMMVFRPSGLLPFSAACSLAVAAGALDTDGQSLAAGAFTRFSVQPEPALAAASVYPPAGPPGTQVVISGAGFSSVPAQNLVLFNGASATVVSSSLSEIVAVVPAQATSGGVTVQVGVATSNPVPFTVLLPDASPGGIVATLDAGAGVRDIAITSNGARAYATNPSSSSVTAYDLLALQVMGQITVGLKPQAIALTPDDRRAYVANTDSDNLSVIDTDSTSATFHTVIATIPVGDQPVDVVISAIGPEVIVVNSGDSTAAMVDADPNSGTYNQVTTTVATGSRGTGVAVSPDGGTAYIVTDDGNLLILDLASDMVTTTVNTGSKGVGVAVSPDGGLAIVLLANGTLAIIDVNPDSDTFGQVTSTVSTGSKGVGVAVSPDGGLVYVTLEDGNNVVVYGLEGGSGGGSGQSILPGTPGSIGGATLTLLEAIPVGAGPAGVTPAPGGGFALVANSSDGTVTVIGLPTSFEPIEIAFDFNPNALNLSSVGAWVKGVLTPPEPYGPEDFDVASIRLEGVLPVDPAGGIEIQGGSLVVKFDRQALSLLLPEGQRVPVTVTGILETRTFTGTDSIKVRRAKIVQPRLAEVVTPNVPYVVQWEVPDGVEAPTVALLFSIDKGRTWTLAANQIANDGSHEWTPPNTLSDSARVAVVLIESSDASGLEVEGVLGVSDLFRISGTTAVVPRPAQLTLAPVLPNPARGPVTLRFGLPRDADVSLDLYDVQGRMVRTLAHGPRAAGWHEVTWKGETEGATRARPGLYFLRLEAEGRTIDQRMVWLQ